MQYTCRNCKYCPSQTGGIVHTCFRCFSHRERCFVIRYKNDNNENHGDMDLSRICMDENVVAGKVIQGYKSKKFYLEVFMKNGLEGKLHGHMKITRGKMSKFEFDDDVKLSIFSSSRSAEEVVEAAKSCSSRFRNYNLCLNNCEDFAVYCKTGKAMSIQAKNKLGILYKPAKIMYEFLLERRMHKELLMRFARSHANGSDAGDQLETDNQSGMEPSGRVGSALITGPGEEMDANTIDSGMEPSGRVGSALLTGRGEEMDTNTVDSGIVSSAWEGSAFFTGPGEELDTNPVYSDTVEDVMKDNRGKRKISDVGPSKLPSSSSVGRTRQRQDEDEVQEETNARFKPARDLGDNDNLVVEELDSCLLKYQQNHLLPDKQPIIKMPKQSPQPQKLNHVPGDYAISQKNGNATLKQVKAATSSKRPAGGVTRQNVKLGPASETTHQSSDDGKLENTRQDINFMSRTFRELDFIFFDATGMISAMLFLLVAVFQLIYTICPTPSTCKGFFN